MRQVLMPAGSHGTSQAHGLGLGLLSSPHGLLRANRSLADGSHGGVRGLLGGSSFCNEGGTVKLWVLLAKEDVSC